VHRQGEEKRMDIPNSVRLRRPVRKTWTAFGNLGRRPSEYEIVTHKMNHTLRDPPLELSPDSHGNARLKRHRDAIRLKVPDWDAFRGPDQLIPARIRRDSRMMCTGRSNRHGRVKPGHDGWGGTVR
jgi:hypothetical protein